MAQGGIWEGVLSCLEAHFKQHPEVVKALVAYVLKPGTRTFTMYACDDVIFKAKSEEFYGGAHASEARRRAS